MIGIVCSIDQGLKDIKVFSLEPFRLCADWAPCLLYNVL